MATPTRIAAETLAARLREENECAHPSEMAVALAEDPSVLVDWLERAMVLRANENDAKLRQAAQALVAELESTSGDWPRLCDAPRCNSLALVEDGDQSTCDEHQGILVDGEVEDLSYAPALRTLRALLEGGSR